MTFYRHRASETAYVGTTRSSSVLVCVCAGDYVSTDKY